MATQQEDENKTKEKKRRENNNNEYRYKIRLSFQIVCLRDLAFIIFMILGEHIGNYIWVLYYIICVCDCVIKYVNGMYV